MPPAEPPVPRELVDVLEQGAQGLIPDDVPLVLAVSGGADSMALQLAAAALAPARGWRLTVAHLDHRLREDSGADARFVADAAARLDLPFELGQADVGALAVAEGRSVEDAGREARYRFLGEVAGRLGPHALVATAHTLDDSAETVLLNLVRGSGLAGLRGIPARRARIVRPLLGARRAELRSALDAAGIDYRRDPSNDDPSFARNRLRLEVLPVLERLNPAIVPTLARYARLAADDDQLLDAIAAAELAARRAPDGSVDWRDPPTRPLARRMVRRLCGEPAPSSERVEALIDAAEGPRGGLTIELGGGRSASVRGRRIRIGPA